MNRNLQRIYRKVLYTLKRQYGDAITLCRNTSVSANYETGVKSYVCSRTKINRAILLPTNYSRDTGYGISTISANKMFVFGGTFDLGTKIIIVDTSDLPEYYQLSLDDWILIDNLRYEIVKIEQLEYQAGWVIGTKQVVGVTPDLEITLDASDALSLDSDGSGNKEVPITQIDNLGLTHNGSSV